MCTTHIALYSVKARSETRSHASFLKYCVDAQSFAGGSFSSRVVAVTALLSRTLKLKSLLPAMTTFVTRQHQSAKRYDLAQMTRASSSPQVPLISSSGSSSMMQSGCDRERHPRKPHEDLFYTVGEQSRHFNIARSAPAARNQRAINYDNIKGNDIKIYALL